MAVRTRYPALSRAILTGADKEVLLSLAAAAIDDDVGIDLGVGAGLAVCPGNSDCGGYGNCVVIDHGAAVTQAHWSTDGRQVATIGSPLRRRAARIS